MSFDILMFNQSWFAPELRSKGHTVLTAGFQSPHLDLNFEANEIDIAQVIEALPPGFVPERIVFHDNSGIPWLIGIEQFDVPKIFYSVDTHHHYQWHGLYGALFDHVLVAQLQYLESFPHNQGRVSWFPPWAPIYLEPASEKTIDVCFRGTFDPALNPNRVTFFKELAEKMPIDYGSGEYTKSYPLAKIVINQAVKADLNFRVFETLMSGALLITPEGATGLDALFTAGDDLVTYLPGSVDDAAAKLAHYLAHDEARTRPWQRRAILRRTLPQLRNPTWESRR